MMLPAGIFSDRSMTDPLVRFCSFERLLNGPVPTVKPGGNLKRLGSTGIRDELGIRRQISPDEPAPNQSRVSVRHVILGHDNLLFMFVFTVPIGFSHGNRRFVHQTASITGYRKHVDYTGSLFRRIGKAWTTSIKNICCHVTKVNNVVVSEPFFRNERRLSGVQ